MVDTPVVGHEAKGLMNDPLRINRRSRSRIGECPIVDKCAALISLDHGLGSGGREYCECWIGNVACQQPGNPAGIALPRPLAVCARRSAA